MDQTLIPTALGQVSRYNWKNHRSDFSDLSYQDGGMTWGYDISNGWEDGQVSTKDGPLITENRMSLLKFTFESMS